MKPCRTIIISYIYTQTHRTPYKATDTAPQKKHSSSTLCQETALDYSAAARRMRGIFPCSTAMNARLFNYWAVRNATSLV